MCHSSTDRPQTSDTCHPSASQGLSDPDASKESCLVALHYLHGEPHPQGDLCPHLSTHLLPSSSWADLLPSWYRRLLQVLSKVCPISSVALELIPCPAFPKGRLSYHILLLRNISDPNTQIPVSSSLALQEKWHCSVHLPSPSHLCPSPTPHCLLLLLVFCQLLSLHQILES